MDNNLILKRFFSKSMLHDLLSGDSNDVFEYVVRRYVSDPTGRSYKDLISEIYKYMGKEYRSEYFYKNIMLNKLLMKKHDYKKTIVLTELPIASSKADFIMINGRGKVSCIAALYFIIDLNYYGCNVLFIMLFCT